MAKKLLYCINNTINISLIFFVLNDLTFHIPTNRREIKVNSAFLKLIWIKPIKRVDQLDPRGHWVQWIVLFLFILNKCTKVKTEAKWLSKQTLKKGTKYIKLLIKKVSNLVATPSLHLLWVNLHDNYSITFIFLLNPVKISVGRYITNQT